jgi:hypothetical protein
MSHKPFFGLNWGFWEGPVGFSFCANVCAAVCVWGWEGGRYVRDTRETPDGIFQVETGAPLDAPPGGASR